MLKSMLIRGAAICSLVAGFAGPATAQTTPEAAATPDQGGVAVDAAASGDEIIVTAQKRSENIQDVPISISAVTGETLRAAEATRLTDIAAAVPGLQVDSQTGQPGSVNVTLRGITTADIQSTTTAITVDDIPVGSSTTYAYAALSNIDLLPYDLDRVEVLKGPQGTLYGASSLGGLVKYVTTNPDLGELSGRVGGTVSDIAHSSKVGASIRGALNLPLIRDKMALAIGAGHSYRPGYIRNIATGEDDFNHGTQDNLRATLLFRPDGAFRAKLTALYNKSDFHGLGGIAFDPVANEPTYGYYETSFNKPFRDRREAVMLIGDLSYDFGFATLTSLTGYSDLKGTVLYDASEIPFYKATYQANGILTPGEFTSRTKRFTQELRLASNGEGRLQWLLGAFYNRERSRYREQIEAVFAANDELVPALDPFYSNDRPSRYEEKAVFGNLTFEITDAWDVSGGLRYSRNKQRVSANEFGSLIGGGGQSPEFRSSDSSVTWAVNTRFHLSRDAMLYARVATGYRPGGANTVAGVPATFEPDETTSYEVGLKSELFDRRLLFNLAAFYIDWTNIHLTDRLPNQVPFTGNAGKAESYGLELASSLKITDSLRFGVTGAYTVAELKADAPAVGAASGDRLPNTPRLSGVVSADWSQPISDRFTADAGVAFRYVGSRLSNFPLAQGGAAHLDSYTSLDLTAGVAMDEVRLGLFVKNLTDNRGYLSYSNFGATILQPRTIGVNVDWSF
jgi:outer membrane receptor protein involved in Fe transport